jgi:hypothetical protein
VSYFVEANLPEGKRYLSRSMSGLPLYEYHPNEDVTITSLRAQDANILLANEAKCKEKQIGGGGGLGRVK